MRRECRERFPRHRLQRKPLVSDPGMHQGTCVTHVPICISGSLTRGGGENVPDIPVASPARNFTYLVRCSRDAFMVSMARVHPTKHVHSFVVVICSCVCIIFIMISWLICLYHSGWFYWHCGSSMIVRLSVSLS